MMTQEATHPTIPPGATLNASDFASNSTGQAMMTGLSFDSPLAASASSDLALLNGMLHTVENNRVALLPFGAIAQGYSAQVNSDVNKTAISISYYDRTPQPEKGVMASSDISNESAEYFLILSYTYDAELKAMLLAQGVEEWRIISIRRFPEYIQTQYWQQSVCKALVNEVPKFDGNTILLTDCADSCLKHSLENAGLTLDYVMDMQTSGVHRDNSVAIPHAFLSTTSLPENSRIIALCLPYHNTKIRQHLRHISPITPVIFPFAARGNTMFSPRLTPTLFLSFPHAGHGRFAPVLTSLAGQLGRKQQAWEMLSKNQRYAELYSDAKPSELFELAHDDLLAKARSVDWCNYAITHDIYDITRLKSSAWKGLNIVQLMRDPRDILTSVVMRVDPDNFEAACLRFMDGSFYFKTSTNLLYWPSIKEICRRFAFGCKHENVFTVKFEDLHHQPEQTYRDLFASLGWDDQNNPQLSDIELTNGIALGSFSHQTQNKLSRGEQATKLIGSCRKGIVGDWRNQWTPRLVEAFKLYCEAEFMLLGYESSLQWSLDSET